MSDPLKLREALEAARRIVAFYESEPKKYEVGKTYTLTVSAISNDALFVARALLAQGRDEGVGDGSSTAGAVPIPPDHPSAPATMVERVANVIRATEGCSDSFVGCDLCEQDRPDSCLNVARAAIKAMREPNLAMRKVCLFETAEEWPAMIDAALAEGRPDD